MAFLTHFRRDLEQLLFRNRDQHAIPPMDGALSPNDRLDECLTVGEPLPEADDVVEGPDGALYVSAGPRVWRLDGPGYGRREIVARFEHDAGGVALHPDGRLLVCVAGEGLAAIDGAGTQRWLRAANGEALGCPTSVAAAPDGAIYLTDGSRRHGPREWCRDLLEKNRLGRLIACTPDLGTATVLADDLHWPNGAALSADGKALWYVEGWRHRVSRAPRDGGGIGRPETMIRNLPGYPARLKRAAAGGFWLGLFALRTHLVELVLREDEYRDEMMRTIDPALWVAPALSSTGFYLEPLQLGGIKKLGIQKPWSPPRSYGLVMHIDEHGDAVESLHSRVGGRYHGITSAVDTAQGLVILSMGAGRVLLRGREAQA